MKLNKWAGPCLVAMLLGGGLAGCGGSDSPVAASTPSPAPSPSTPAAVTFNAKAVIDNSVDNVIVPTYQALNDRAADLLAAVQTLNTTPDDTNLDAAQAAWRAARVPWETSEGFLFGPVDALQIDPSIDSWPLNTDDLVAFLTANPTATQEQVENASDDVRGFHAIEYLLFGDGVSSNDQPASALAGGGNAAKRNYLVALTQAFKARTQLLVDAWTVGTGGSGPYAAVVKSPGSGNASYGGPAAVLEELIGGIAGIVDEVGNAKISEPLGASLAEADTSKVESQYSWNSLTDFHNNIQSVLNVYTGKRGFQPSSDTASAGQNGLFAFVVAHDAALAARVLEQILDAQRKIALIKGDGNSATTEITGGALPFRTQISSTAGRALIGTAIDALALLQRTLQTEVRPLVEKTTFSN